MTFLLLLLPLLMARVGMIKVVVMMAPTDCDNNDDEGMMAVLMAEVTVVMVMVMRWW